MLLKEMRKLDAEEASPTAGVRPFCCSSTAGSGWPTTVTSLMVVESNEARGKTGICSAAGEALSPQLKLRAADTRSDL